MSEGPTDTSKPYDPMEAFRGMRDAYLDAMAKTMVDAVNTESYAQATGAMLEGTLTVSAPIRDAMEKSMLQVLQQLSLPSRQDIISLADRFTNLELRLDDMDAALELTEPKVQKAILPVLQQLIILTETLTTLLKRVETLETTLGLRRPAAGSRTTKVAQAVKKPTSVGVTPRTTTRARRSTGSTVPAKSAKRTVRKGAR